MERNIIVTVARAKHAHELNGRPDNIDMQGYGRDTRERRAHIHDLSLSRLPSTPLSLSLSISVVASISSNVSRASHPLFSLALARSGSLSLERRERAGERRFLKGEQKQDKGDIHIKLP